jgi:hypothetical protein
MVSHPLGFRLRGCFFPLRVYFTRDFFLEPRIPTREVCVRVLKKSMHDFHFKLYRINAGYQAQLRFFEKRGDRFDLLPEQV